MDSARFANKTTYWLAMLWLIFAGLMVSAAMSSPASSHSYGGDAPGTLPICLLASLVEIGGFWALLQPWAPSFSWIRLFTVGGALLLTFALSSMLSLHAGPIAMAHLGWLMALQATWLGLLVRHVFMSAKAPRIRKSSPWHVIETSLPLCQKLHTEARPRTKPQSVSSLV